MRLILGLALIFIVTTIPYLGDRLGFLTLLVGSGAIVTQLRERIRA